MGLTPGEMVAAVTRNLPEKTGRTLEAWVEVLKNEGPGGEIKQQRDWLKSVHGLGSTAAMIVAETASGGGSLTVYQDPAALLDLQYKGKKAELRPIYDALVHAARRIGDDVKVAPCQTYVPLMRRHQFAVIKPTTATRVDLGLALPDVPPEGRLVKVKNFGGGDRITHRIPLASLKDVDAEVVRWLKKAYDAAATGKRKQPAKSPAAGSKRR